MNKRKSSVLLCSLILASNYVVATDEKSGLHLGMIHCCIQSDVFMWNIAQNIQSLAKHDGNSITFINANGNQQAELDAIKELADKKVDGLIMSIVIDDTLDKPFQKKLIDEIKKTHLPTVFYLLAPQPRFMETYKKAYRVGSTPAQSGILQGDMVSKAWLAHPEWDKNHDGIMQYALLKGPNGNPDAEERTKWVRATLQTFPVGNIKSKEVNFAVANFYRQKAKDTVSQWIDNGDAKNIEVLIANNDDMMLGSYDAFINHHMTPPALFGIDALPETLKLIKEGKVAGTVLQDTKEQALNTYKLAVNLASEDKNTDNVDYPVVNQEMVVPYIPVTKENVNDIKN